MKQILIVLGVYCASLTAAPAIGLTPPPPNCRPYFDKTLSELVELARKSDVSNSDAQSCLPAAFNGLGRSALPTLITMLTSKDERLLSVSARSLAYSDAAEFKQALPALLQAYVNASSPTISYEIEYALVQHGKDAAPALPYMLREFQKAKSDKYKRSNMFQNYARLAEASGDAVLPLAQLLTVPDIYIQLRAAGRLAEMGESAKAAVEPMKQAIEKLINVQGETPVAGLFAALTAIDDVSDAVAFLGRQATLFPNWNSTILSDLRLLKARNAAITGTALVKSLKNSATLATSAEFLRELAVNDAAMTPFLNEAATYLTLLLQDARSADVAALGLLKLRHTAPGAAEVLANLAEEQSTVRARQIVFLGALAVVGGQTEPQLRILLNETVRQLQMPAPGGNGENNPCDPIRALSSVEQLPPAFVPVLENVFFRGLHESNDACAFHILWALRNADAEAGVDAQIKIFLSPKLYDVCNAAIALSPKSPRLIPALAKHLHEAEPVRLALMEKAIAQNDDDARLLKSYAGRVLPHLMKELADPHSAKNRVADQNAERIGSVIGFINNDPPLVHWCGIPSTQVGLAIFRAGNLRIATPALIDKLVMALDNPDSSTSGLAGTVLRKTVQEDELRRKLRMASQNNSKGAGKLLVEIGS